MIDTKAIKVLREKTGAGVLEIKEALEKFNGDLKKAESALGKSALTKVSKKKDRIAGACWKRNIYAIRRKKYAT